MLRMALTLEYAPASASTGSSMASVQREPPHKYLLYKPTCNQLLAVLATAQKVRPCGVLGGCVAGCVALFLVLQASAQLVTAAHSIRCSLPPSHQELPAEEGLLLYVSSTSTTHNNACGYHLPPRGAQAGAADSRAAAEDVLLGSDLAFLRRTPLVIIADGMLGAGGQALFVRWTRKGWNQINFIFMCHSAEA
jgi:hypothetical protein